MIVALVAGKGIWILNKLQEASRNKTGSKLFYLFSGLIVEPTVSSINMNLGLRHLLESCDIDFA